MATNHPLNARLRQEPAYLARWFAAVDRCARLSRLAAR
jgi:hypothetical protein